jgi:hypothetical protein
MSGRRWIFRIVVGILLVGWFGVALVDRIQNDEGLWKIGTAVLLVALGAAQIVTGIGEQRRPPTDESPGPPRP